MNINAYLLALALLLRSLWTALLAPAKHWCLIIAGSGEQCVFLWENALMSVQWQQLARLDGAAQVEPLLTLWRCDFVYVATDYGWKASLKWSDDLKLDILYFVLPSIHSAECKTCHCVAIFRKFSCHIVFMGITTLSLAKLGSALAKLLLG